MNLAKLVRYLTVVGALLITLSFLMEWIVVVDGSYLVERPLGVFIIGLALLAESIIPVSEKARKVMPALLVFSGVVAFFVVLWAALYTALRMVSGPVVALGPGPLIALAGLALFVVGVVGSIQVITHDSQGSDDINYRIIGLE